MRLATPGLGVETGTAVETGDCAAGCARGTDGGSGKGELGADGDSGRGRLKSASRICPRLSTAPAVGVNFEAIRYPAESSSCATLS